eukprot:Plantae.Rhodophyta-Purpureofilum_apyrenoidigerum.ctg2777.p1 GENE.Plantae.Rhodophyta-Purpureofilum_apyrenoidigerum.ctg2777~~Plantae.Rhodophyta-Purpureofilum_apyrenoidigerum.ctg2777.p1  ORF type:complete len:198 (+),score=31.16 Plantae.Rhodophyta-Purpureofilum_apyrenoidigerum.ctg2777:171-764(+)
MSRTGAPLARKWGLDLLDESFVSRKNLAGKGKDLVQTYADPPGWISAPAAVDQAIPRTEAQSKERKETQYLAMKEKCRDIALSPGANVLMMGSMLFMTGSGVNMFSIMSTFSMMFVQMKTLSSVTTVFKPYQDAEPRLDRFMIYYKFVYVFLCSVGLAMGLYKAYVLGFLPITESDWASLLTIRHQPEVVAAGMRLT